MRLAGLEVEVPEPDRRWENDLKALALQEEARPEEAAAEQWRGLLEEE